MIKYLKIYSLAFLFIISASSCANLKHVNAYASESLEAIQYFETLNYSFQQACLDKCVEKKIINLEFRNVNCPCEAEKRGR